MSETIFIEFVDPKSTIIKAYPYKVVFEDAYFEFYAIQHIIYDDDEKGKIEMNIDTTMLVDKNAISGFELYRDHQSGNFVFKVTSTSGEIILYFDTKQDGKDLLNKFKTWRYANS